VKLKRSWTGEGDETSQQRHGQQPILRRPQRAAAAISTPIASTITASPPRRPCVARMSSASLCARVGLPFHSMVQ
jgi:hypothetical protein